MKRKRSISKSVLSFCLAVMLMLQAVTLSAPVYAESAPSDSGAALSETGLPDAAGPSVPEAVYDAPKSLAALMEVSTDKTAVFLGTNISFPLEVTQGSAVIEPNGIIQGRQQFTLKSEGLKVPVNGDDENPTNADPEKYIQKGDWIELKREDHFKTVVLPTATKILNAQTESGMKKLGTAYFTPNSIKIVFDGDDNFFNGVGRSVIFSFETTANADVTGMEYGDTKPINIFGGAYQLENPNITPAYAIIMRSMSNNQPDYWRYSRGNTEIKRADFLEGIVEWKADVSASDRDDVTIPVPLDGMKFSNDLTTVGEYVENSFKVLDTRGNPVSATPIYSEGKLSYIFPAEFGDKATVTYKTWVPKEKYYYEYRDIDWGYHLVIHNFAQLYDSKNQEVANSKKAYPEDNGWGVGIKPDWIQASASYDHPNETITWKVTVNQYNKKGLKDFTITNALPSGLEFTSATWQTWVDGTASEVQSIIPDENSVYSFGELNGKVELVIKSKVISGSELRIDPRANWELDTPGGIQNNDVITGLRPVAVTDEAIVTIGAHTFTKSPSITMEDFNLGAVTWTVSLTPQYALPSAAVYDVLVHGGDLNILDNAVDETGEVSKETIAKIKANVTNAAQLWKKYHKGTLKGVNNASGLTLKAIPLTVNGEVVADLIKVTGYTTDKATSFSFRALETDPSFLFKQDINVGKGKSNRALLFDGEAVKSAQNAANLHVRMLNKDMLFASTPLKAGGAPENVTPNNVGSYIRNDSNEAWTISAYDQATKTITFRLGVNMPGYNTEEMAKDGGSRVISNIKLVDTLPEGWEFIPFSEGKDFELWKSYSDNGGGTEYGVKNDARTIIEPGTDAHVVNFSHIGNVGTFTFSKLESPYVILVKARPSNAALETYLEEYITNGTSKQVLYNKADLHMTWGGEEKVVTEQRKIIVPVQALGKSVTKPVPGVLEWTVNYYPPYNMENGVYLQDTMGAGMNLRYDENGKLVLTAPSMAVYRAKLTASGALERDGEALNLSDPNSEVQAEAMPGANGTTILTFKMTDPNQFYQFVYQTEVDPSVAKAGDKMGNEVKLMGDDKLKSVSAKSESTLDNSDVAGSSISNALLPLKKVDPDGNPLQGVRFTLYKKSDGTTAAEGTTDSGGKLNLLFPDPGYYELKETYIDTNTWLPTTRIYQVYVGNTPGKPIWVDGVKVTTDAPLVVPTPAKGKLTISNKVEGNGGDKNKEFEFTVIFDGEGKDESYAYTGIGVTSGSLKSGDTIRLKHGEQITFPILPKGLEYTVIESDYTADGYTTNWPDRTSADTIIKDGTHLAEFINTRMVYGGLLIGETVVGNGADKNKDFEFTVQFPDASAGKAYAYIKSDNTKGTIKSGDTITLKHGETIAIEGIPSGDRYSVTQTDYSGEDYTTDPASRTHSGTIVEKEIAEARFVNAKYLPGKLLIGQTVAGNGGQPDKVFEFTVTFSGAGANGEYDYKMSDGTAGKIKSGNKITLKHGETVVIDGIPKDTTYIVTEADYTEDGYTTDPTSLEHAGTITAGNTAEALFVNTRMVYGSLTIGKKVAGNGGQLDKAFELTITFDGEGKDGSYAYIGAGVPSGSLKSGDTIRLKHGEQITFPKLPKGLTYTVVESDYTADGYTTNWPNRTSADTISEGGEHEALFVNTRLLHGGLLIGQTVKGSGADKDKAFMFTVTFGGAGANEEYTYTKSDGTSGKIKSGDTISLKHGETVAIAETDILTGTTYTVTETDYSGEGYITDPENRMYSGTIKEKQIAEARFVNAKYLPGKLTLTADPAFVPGDGESPSQLTATLTDYEGKPVANTEVIFILPDQSEVKATTDAQGKAVIPYTPPKLGVPMPEDHSITAKVDSVTEGKLTATTTVTAMPAAIIGVLRDNLTGKEIPNADIVVTNDVTGETHTITTDSVGAYFHPVPYGGEYTISYTKKVKINGVDEPITFKQKAELDSNVDGGERVPAHITAVGIVLLKQLEGQTSLLNSELTDKMYIYLKDAKGNYIKENGHRKAFPMALNGTFSVEGLSEQTYTMEVRYKAETGEELLFKVTQLDVKANGELNISEELVDPYGTVYDETTGDADTGKKIDGAKVTLYYADTERNRNNNRLPDTKVTLPKVPNFAPHDNESPEQDSDVNGFYAYMVFPEADYYLIVTKDGYETHRSDTISVDFEIVKYDVPMKPISSGGGNSDNGNSETGNGNSETDNGNSETDNGNNETDNGNNETDNGNNETDNGNNETDNGSNESDNGNSETGNGNSETGNGNNETDGNNGTDNGNSGTSNGNKEADNGSNELDNVPKTGDNSVSPIFYMALALMSLMVIGYCLLSSKMKKHIL